MPIRRTELIPGYPVYEVTHAVASARVAQHGAQIMEWTPTGHKPVLYLSPQALYHEGKAIRGGVPVCWPWFGPHETEEAFPAHGVARSRFWVLAGNSEDASGVMLTFILTDDADTWQLWPHAFRLVLKIKIGAELQITLLMINTGDSAYGITGALHTYLAVGDIHQVRVSGLHGAEYLDLAATPFVDLQHGDLRFKEEVDRDYRASAPVQVHDPAWDRTLTVEGSGSECTVVWNPWIEKAKTLADLPDADFQRFLCVETANAWENRITLPPGGSHVLATTVRVH